jgi:hypothetical protein
MTADLAGVWIWGGERIVQSRLRLGTNLSVDGSKIVSGSNPLRLQPFPKIRDRVAFGLPVCLFLF